MLPGKPGRSRPVVLVTGAARRIGRAIALHLAAHGWDLALHYRGSAAEAEATRRSAMPGARAETFAADLADEAAVRGPAAGGAGASAASTRW
jgi:NAD(P)-dependent dehydrogenase (short-subunit alcohol dehydrogenase family)